MECDLSKQRCLLSQVNHNFNCAYSAALVMLCGKIKKYIKIVVFYVDVFFYIIKPYFDLINIKYI